MKNIFACIIFLLLSSVVFAQELQPKLEKAEAIALAKAVSLGDDSKALDALLEYKSGKEVSPAYLYNIAILHANLSNTKEAISFYAKAIEGFEGFYLAHKNIAFCYANLNEYESALEHISKAAALGGLDLQMYMCVAKSNLSLNNYAEALFALKNAQMLSPKDENVKANILYCLSQLGLWEELKITSENILAGKEKSLKAWRSLLLALLNLEDEDSAIATVEAMRLLDIAEAKDIEILANTYFNKGLYSKAVDLYMQIKDDLDQEKRARISTYLVELSQADRAIELAPDSDLGNFAKARAYRAKNDLDKAEVYLNKSLRENPLNEKFLMLLAEIQIDKGDFALAKITLNRLKSNAELGYKATYMLSYIAIKEQDYELALTLLKQIRNSKNFDYIDSYIRVLEKDA